MGRSLVDVETEYHKEKTMENEGAPQKFKNRR